MIRRQYFTGGQKKEGVSEQWLRSSFPLTTCDQQEVMMPVSLKMRLTLRVASAEALKASFSA